MKETERDTDYRKPCTICNTLRNVLIRCQIDASGKWNFICSGSCWEKVSGGVVDGDGKDEHRFYRYGGMWKNKHDAASARMPRRVKERQKALRWEKSGSCDGNSTTASAKRNVNAPSQTQKHETDQDFAVV